MYKLVLKIAWTSISRRKTRTWLVIAMICISLWAILLMEGLYEGMTEQMIDNAIRSSCGDITIFARGYRNNPGIDKFIEDPENISQMLKSDSRVKSLVSRIEQHGLIATPGYSRNVRIFGIKLEAENENARLAGYMQEGSYDFGPEQHRAVIGAGLAEKMKISPGKKVVISTQNVDGEISSLPFRISGIIRTNNIRVDEMGLFIDRDMAAELTGLELGVTRINLLLHKQDKIRDLQNDLKREFPDLSILRWDEMYPALMQSRVMMKSFSMVTNSLVFLIAGLGIFGVILVSVMERRREFGILLAIGTGFSLITVIVLVESLMIALAGYLAGALLGGVSLWYFAVYGLDLTVFASGLHTLGIDAVTHARIEAYYFITAFAAILFATLLSVIIPLRQLKKAQPIESITGIK